MLSGLCEYRSDRTDFGIIRSVIRRKWNRSQAIYQEEEETIANIENMLRAGYGNAKDDEWIDNADLEDQIGRASCRERV